jgi:L-lactate dehydrogenase complex protein LldG
MSESRDNILSRLKMARPDFPDAEIEKTVSRPTLTSAQRIDQFRRHLEAVRAEVHLTGRTEWVTVLQRLAREKGIEALLHAPDGPLGDQIAADWDRQAGPRLKRFAQEIDSWKEPLFFDTAAAVTSVRAGIAATGTLVLWPTVEEPRSYSLVPPVHIAVLEAERLHDTFEHLMEAEAWHQGMPTNALLISGPSKTADIEQTLSYGIHGPTQLIVLLLQ